MDGAAGVEMIDGKYRFILTIAAKRSFSKAAEDLYISQSHLSHLVASVEKELHIRIFDRSRKPLSLTEDGRIYVEYMEKILALEKGLKEALQKEPTRQEKIIHLGMGPARTPLVAPLVLKYFENHFPDIRIEIVEDNSNEGLLKKVLDGTLQLAFYTSPDPPAEVDRVVLYKELLWLVLPADHLLETDKREDTLYSEDLKKLEQNKFLVLQESYGLGQYAREFFRKYDFHPKKIFTVKNLESLQSLAASGIGITLLPTTWKERSFTEISPQYYKIGEPPFGREIYMIYQKSHELTESEKVVCRLCSHH